VWLLRYQAGEIDDGALPSARPMRRTLAYAAHFTHDVNQLTGHHGHIVGPTLKPLVARSQMVEAEKEGFEPSMEAFTPITP
jgi:hypothetical protein